MSAIESLLSNNAQWAEDVEKSEPGFFKRGAEGQWPKVNNPEDLTEADLPAGSLDRLRRLQSTRIRCYWLQTGRDFCASKYCKVSWLLKFNLLIV